MEGRGEGERREEWIEGRGERREGWMEGRGEEEEKKEGRDRGMGGMGGEEGGGGSQKRREDSKTADPAPVPA